VTPTLLARKAIKNDTAATALADTTNGHLGATVASAMAPTPRTDQKTAPTVATRVRHFTPAECSNEYGRGWKAAVDAPPSD